MVQFRITNLFKISIKTNMIIDVYYLVNTKTLKYSNIAKQSRSLTARLHTEATVTSPKFYLAGFISLTSARYD